MSVTSALRALNNAVLDLQSADFNTYEHPLQRMGAALADPALAPIVSDLKERADFEAFLENAHQGGSMMGSARLNWPTDEAETLGLVVQMIERGASDPNWFRGIAHRYYYSTNGKIMADIRKLITAVILPFNRDFANYVKEHPVVSQPDSERINAVSEQDKRELLWALYQVGKSTEKRPSLMDARLKFLPEWDSDRITNTAEALLGDGDILNPTGAPVYVDLASHARKLFEASGANSPASVTYNINTMTNSPIQHIEAHGHGIQTTSYKSADLASIVDLYRTHVEKLGLEQADRRRADAQVATIEAQLLDEPDPTIIQAAGKSLKTIVEGALGGAAGNAMATAATWAPLLALF